MNIIPITPATLDIIEVLNGGVRPKLKTGEVTFYIFKGKDEHADIITESELERMFKGHMAIVRILYAYE